MILSIIAAIARNRVIGNEGALPWRFTSDFEWFKKITMGHPIIMGRKTHESLKRALPDRVNIVITRQKNPKLFGDISVTASLEKAVRLAEESGASEAFIIGGAKVYAEALEKKLVDKMYLTRIGEDYKGDTFFPEFPEEEWRMISEKTIWERTREWIDIKLRFCVFEKI